MGEITEMRKFSTRQEPGDNFLEQKNGSKKIGDRY